MGIYKQWNEILKDSYLLGESDKDLDVWFGPRFFRNDPKILDLFTRKYELKNPTITGQDEYKHVNVGKYSNATFFPLAALAQGRKVSSVGVPYVHPKEQTKQELGENREEFMKKREAQQEGIVAEAKLFIEFIEGKPVLVEKE